MNLSLVKYHFRLIYRCRGGESGEVLDSEDWSTGTMCVTSLFFAVSISRDVDYNLKEGH